MIKKLSCFVLGVLLIPFLFLGCNNEKEESKIKVLNPEEKIVIIATLFPQYDFTRQIVGDKAEVKLLLPPGGESHSYEPTTDDIIKINKADMFVYTGKYMEPWSERIISGITNKEVKILDVSNGIELSKEENNEEEEHKHENHVHDENKHTEHEYNPHIWTSPVIANKMVDNILNELCSIDPNNADYYKDNANKYKEKLDSLDKEFKEIVKESKRKTIVFGGRYAFHYFEKEYGLNHISAYDSCSSETEPSVATISKIIDYVKKENIPIIYYEELTTPKVAKSISEETGIEMLLLHSAHNVSKEDFKKGISYVDLMTENARNLKRGLQ